MLNAYDRSAGRPVTGGWIALVRSGQSARGLAHAQTLRVGGACGERASVLECGGPPPLWPAPNCKRTRQKLWRPFIFHSSFSIFHLKIGGFKVIQGCSKLNFFRPAEDSPKPSARQHSYRQHPGFTSASHARFPATLRLGAVHKDPESAPVRPSQTFEILQPCPPRQKLPGCPSRQAEYTRIYRKACFWSGAGRKPFSFPLLLGPRLGIYAPVTDQITMENRAGGQSQNLPLRILHLEDNPADTLLVRDQFADDGVGRRGPRMSLAANDFVQALESRRGIWCWRTTGCRISPGWTRSSWCAEKFPSLPFILMSGTHRRTGGH